MHKNPLRHSLTAAFMAASTLGLPAYSSAQQLLSNSGGESTNTGLRLSFSIGELSVATLTLSNTILTQGFQQPDGNGAPLPLEWLSFAATLVDNEARLQWVTARESGNDHFEVERSADGKSFSTFTTVAAVGNSTGPFDYTTTDPNPYPGISFYRVRQVDRDGQSTYSTVASIHWNPGMQGSVFPNPVQDVLFVDIDLPAPAELILDLYDPGGRRLLTRQLTAVAGSNRLSWDLHSLAPGVYFIRSRTAGPPAALPAGLPVIKIIKK